MVCYFLLTPIDKKSLGNDTIDHLSDVAMYMSIFFLQVLSIVTGPDLTVIQCKE